MFEEQALAIYDEWTPEAIRRRRKKLKTFALMRWAVPQPSYEQANDETEEDDEPLEIGESDFRRLLTRRSVPWGQQQLFRALYEAGEDGLTNDELVREMGRKDRRDLSGVLGALGRRVNGTSGYGKSQRPGLDMVLRAKWEGDGNRYWLRDDFRDYLEEMAPKWLEDVLDR